MNKGMVFAVLGRVAYFAIGALVAVIAMTA
jgi:hypothetical protein